MAVGSEMHIPPMAVVEVVIPDCSGYRLYTRRWFILFVYCLIVACQNSFWNTYGPIAPFAVTYYDTSLTMINMLSGLGPICFIPASFVTVWFIDKVGMRKTVLTFALLVSSGGVIRCLHFESFGKFNIAFPIVGQFLNNIAGPLSMIVQTKLSSVWFGPSERTLSTAIAAQANVFGVAASYLLSLRCGSAKDVPGILYVYAIAGITAIVLTVVYFPEAPPTPPSPSGEQSAAAKAVPPLEVLKNSIKCFGSSSAFIMIVLASAPLGIYSGWGAILVEIVTPLGFSETQAEWLGFWAMLAGGVGGVVFGKLHDLYKHYKRLLIGLYLLNLVCFVWFTLTVARTIPGGYYGAMASNVIAGLLMGAPSGIVYEGLVELTYPIPEQTGLNIFSVLYNVWVLFFLICGSYILPAVINWVLCGSLLVALVSLCFMKEYYPRSTVDKGYQPVQ